MKLKSFLRYSIYLISSLYFGVIQSQNQNIYYLGDWIEGTGSITDFDDYGTQTSNVRELGVNNVGQEKVLWKAIPDPSTSAEGGIYANYKAIDISKTYRYSIWIKKNNSNDGTTYFGCHSTNGGNHQTLRLDNSVDTNPYFWYGDLPKLNHWYLLVGYVHSSDYSGASIGKIYDGETGEVVQNTYRDFKFSPNAVNLRLRAFLYNDPNQNDRQYLYKPIMEVIDGTESSIENLLNINPDSKLIFAYDNAGNQKQRFYCAVAGCTVPNPPAGRVAPDDVVASKETEEDIVKEAKVDEANFLEKELTLFPNPTDAIVSLKFNSSSDITLSHDINVYNSAGILVKTVPSNTKNELEIDFTNLASGMYLVHIHLSNGTSITKQIIKN